MKKFLFVTCLLLMLLTFIGCTYIYEVDDFKAINQKIDDFEYNIEGKLYYFDNEDEVTKLNEVFSKYDKTYFTERSLIVVTVMSSMNTEYSMNKIKNHTVSIFKNPTEDLDITEWTLIIEVKKKIKEPQYLSLAFLDRPTHVHSFTDEIVPPTCIEEGYTLHKCDCGYAYKDKFVEKSECKYENGVCIWCGKEQLIDSYNESIHSQDLTETTIGLFYDGTSEMEGCGYKDISVLYGDLKNNCIEDYKYIDMTAEFDDYYTCCYFNLDKKYLLDSMETIESISFEEAYYNQPWGAWSGINFYLARFNLFNIIQGGWQKESSIVKTEDIKWLEIPKNEEIPSEINNYFLIAITESKTVIETPIFGGEQKEYKWYFESKHLYNDGLKYPEYEEFYNDWINQRYLTNYCHFATLFRNGALNSFSGLHLLKHNVLRIEKMDNVDYIRTFATRTLWGEQDLKDIFEYKETISANGKNYCWFKYSDIFSLLNQDN